MKHSVIIWYIYVIYDNQSSKANILIHKHAFKDFFST